VYSVYSVVKLRLCTAEDTGTTDEESYP